MNDTQFHQLADKLSQFIEDGLDNYDGDSDIDFEVNGNVMTLSFENGSKIIINRQESMHQVWLASKSGGYHFEYRDDNWFCDRTGRSFIEILTEACTQQAEEPVSF